MLCVMPASTPINTRELTTGQFLRLSVAAGAAIFCGTLVAVDSNGRAVIASDAASIEVFGRAEVDADNTGGADDALAVLVKQGVFKYPNSATHPISQANILGLAYVEDNQTVSASKGNNAVIAGRILGIDNGDNQVWIDTRVNHQVSADSLSALTFTNAGATGAEVGALRDAIKAILEAQGLMK